MIFVEVSELDLISVIHRGIANKEAVVIKARQQCNMGQFGMMIGRRDESGLTLPLIDSFFWFGDGIVYENDWIFLYTCKGDASRWVDSTDKSNNYSVFWGRNSTTFANSNIVPLLFKIETVTIGKKPDDVAQQGQAAITQ